MTDILHDKTNKVLRAMSVPISLGMLSTFLFQIVDTYFVGKLGANSLTAISFSSTIFFLLVGLFMGLAVGVSIIVGQGVGAGDKPKVYKTLRIGIVLCLVLSTALTGLMVFFIDPIFTILGATDDVLPLIQEYTIPILFGVPLLSTGILIGAVLRASGDIVKPEVLMGIAGIINLILDYGLIFGAFGLPELGLKGAAYATVISWAFIFLGMFFLAIKDNLIQLGRIAEYKTKAILTEIKKLSVPTIVTQIIGPLTLMYLTYLLAKESPLAVAAFGVSGRIEIVLMIGILAVSNAATPFIAQNQGAHQKERIDEAIVFSGKSATYLGIITAIILLLFIKPIASIFSDDQEVVTYISDYFYIVSLSYVFYGIYIVTTAIFNGLKLTSKSLKLSAVKAFLFTIPFTLIGSNWGVDGIFIGLAVGNVCAGLYAGYEMRKEERRIHSKLADKHVWKDYLNDFRWLIGKSKKAN